MIWKWSSSGSVAKRRVSTPTVAELLCNGQARSGRSRGGRSTRPRAGTPFERKGEPSFCFLFGVKRRRRSSERPPAACARAQRSACARVHMAVQHAKHADIMLHTTIDVHAECHASHAHMRRARGRDRLGPGSTEADGCMLCACNLACIPYNVISDVHATCHATFLSCRRAGL